MSWYGFAKSAARRAVNSLRSENNLVAGAMKTFSDTEHLGHHKWLIQLNDFATVSGNVVVTSESTARWTAQVSKVTTNSSAGTHWRQRTISSEALSGVLNLT